VHSISTDKEFPEIIWIDAVINYRANQNDNYQCIQNGHINSNQLYRFSDSRYLIAFDVLDQIDEKAFE
jgi:hypothetical protein